jgi:hypothetical protein
LSAELFSSEVQMNIPDQPIAINLISKTLLVSAFVGGCVVVFVLRVIKTVKDRRDSKRIYEVLRRLAEDGQHTFRSSERISRITNLTESRISDLCSKHPHIERKEHERHVWRVVGRPPYGDELPKQDPIPPRPASDQPVFGVPVPNYNTQRPQVQNKKTWWRWDFVRRWRKVISPRNWRLLQRQRHGKNQLDAIWEALSRMNTNINVIRSVWRRRAKKDIKIRDLTPLADVKAGGGVKSESKPTTGGTGGSGATGTRGSR